MAHAYQKLDHLQRIMLLQGDFEARIQSFQNSGSCSNTNGKRALI